MGTQALELRARIAERGALSIANPACERATVSLDPAEVGWRVALELDGRRVEREVGSVDDAVLALESWLPPPAKAADSQEGQMPAPAVDRQSLAPAGDAARPTVPHPTEEHRPVLAEGTAGVNTSLGSDGSIWWGAELGGALVEASNAQPALARPARAQPAAAAHSTSVSTAPLQRSDSAFRSAWLLLQDGKAAEAARGFDALSREPSLDPERRADALYWAARAHERAGNRGAAQARAQELVESSPNAWHAPEAALLAGESLLRSGDRSAARRWLERARANGASEVRARAEALLAGPDASGP